MRVIFLYTSYGAAGVGTTPPWDKEQESKNHFVGIHGIETEGYLYMLVALKKLRVIDDLLVFIESNRHTGHKIVLGTKCYVVPRIDYVEDFLKDDDVLFVRGGWRGWYDPFLLKMQKQKRWLINYAANTGRQRWTVWDIVLSDLSTKHSYDKRGRFWFQFSKPINPEIFHPKQIDRDYDVCIGASKIHDKKAQWRVIDALIKHKEIYGTTLKCVMPGAIRWRGIETPQVVPKINKHDLNVEQPGFVDRYALSTIMNRSKVFVYLGNSGENDRGPLEATCVGCPTLLGGTSRHAPFLRDNEKGILVSKDCTDPSIVAKEIQGLLDIHDENLRRQITSHYERNNGFYSVVIPKMSRLFDTIRMNPTPSVDALRKEYRI